MADSSVHISRGRRQYLADLQLLQAAAVLNELTINEVTVVDLSVGAEDIFMPDLRYCWE